MLASGYNMWYDIKNNPESGDGRNMEQKKSKRTVWQTICLVFGVIKKVIYNIGLWIFRLRRFWMAAPVVYAAIQLAMYSNEHLPEYVGIDLQETGEFAQVISRELAVKGPLAVTAACLLLMFFTRKTLYPWLISIFSLALPLLLLLTNVFPA